MYVIFNSHAGTSAKLGLTAEALADKLTAAGLSFQLDLDEERPLAESIDRAEHSAADVILAAGGDGTVTMLAEAASRANKTLALLPLGTANLLARDLAIPLDLDLAIQQMLSMTPQRIDMAEVNGRTYLHKVVIGTFPEIAAEREKIRDENTFSSRLRFVQESIALVANSKRIAVRIESPEH